MYAISRAGGSHLRMVSCSLFQTVLASCTHVIKFNKSLDFIHHLVFQTEHNILETGFVSALSWKGPRGPF